MSKLSPPLYVTLSSPKGDGFREQLVTSGNRIEIDEGRWHCDVTAPNGARATRTVEVGPHGIPYGSLLDLFAAQSDARELWLSPSPTAVFNEKTSGLGVCAWSDGKPIDRKLWTLKIVDRGNLTAELVVERTDKGPIEFVQVWSNHGASVLCHWQAEGRLLLTAGVPGRDRQVRPVVVGPPSTVTAYWSFLAKRPDAAFRIGADILESNRAGGVSPEHAVLLAHWMIMFGVDDAELEATIIDALAKCGADPDATALRWILAFDRGGVGQEAEAQTLFQRLLKTLRSHLPVYSETVRLITERLTEAVADLRSETRPVGQRLTEDVAWFKLLATSAYWDVEHTTFRGISPNQPNPSAIGVNIDAGAKKKCARWHRA